MLLFFAERDRGLVRSERAHHREAAGPEGQAQGRDGRGRRRRQRRRRVGKESQEGNAVGVIVFMTIKLYFDLFSMYTAGSID